MTSLNNGSNRFSQSNLSTAVDKITKIEILLQKLMKNYQKQTETLTTFTDINEFNADFFKFFKQMADILHIVTIEIVHTLEDLGLVNYQSLLLSLFQFFKHSSLSFMKGNVSFFYMLIKAKEKDTVAEENEKKKLLFQEILPEFVEYIKEMKGLKKNQARVVKGNYFEQMEKIQFLLEQEGYELDQLLQETIHSKDEIDAFLKNKLNTKTVVASGAYKVLETIVFSHPNEINYDDLLKVVNKKIESEQGGKGVSRKNMIHEITRNIFTKIQKAQQKKVKDSAIFTSDFYRSKHDKFDLDNLTLEKSVQTEDEEEMFHRKSLAVKRMLKNKEVDNYTKDLESYNEEILRKCHAMELLKNGLENEKDDFIMKTKHLELKLKVKKEKNENLKILVKELKEKLEELAQKEATSLQNLKIKEKEFEKLAVSQEEKNTALLIQIKDLVNKNEFLERRAREIFHRQNSKQEEKYPSASQSPSHKIDLDKSPKSNTKENFIQKESKKNDIKRKRASTMDAQIINRLAYKNPVGNPPNLLSQKNQIKENIKNKTNVEVADHMTRSKSVFVKARKSGFKEPIPKPKVSLQSSLSIDNNDKNTMNSIKENDSIILMGKDENNDNLILNKKFSLPGNMVKSNFLQQWEDNNQLETLFEGSQKSSSEEIFEMNNYKEENKEMRENYKKFLEKPEFLKEKTQNSNNQTPRQVTFEKSIIEEENKKKNPPTNEIPIATDKVIIDSKEKEATANFVDKVDIYLNKLQKMSEKNNIKIKTILSKLFLHRNHQAFLDALLNFLQNQNLKFVEKAVQTENSLTNAVNSSMYNSTLKIKPKSQDSFRLPNKSSKFEDINRQDYIGINELLNRDPTQNFKKEENFRSQYKNARTQKSYSHHESTNFTKSKPVIFDGKGLTSREEKLLSNYYGEKNIIERPGSLTSFLFNKAIKGDVFGELNMKKNKKNMKFNELIHYGLKQPNNFQEEMILKIDLNEEREEEFMKEELIKRVSNHIKEIQKKDHENFSKIKHFFKYPFKSIKERVGNEIEIGIEDGQIENLVKSFIEKHRICGDYCKHLQRFYRRIGFLNFQSERRQIHLHKHHINKLPNLEENQ